MRMTCQSDVGKLRRVIVKHARDAFVDDAAIDRQWQDLNYCGRPDLGRAIAEYDRFTELLQGFGAEVEFLPLNDSVGMDSLYPRDTAIATDRGMILCNMGKPARRTEPSALSATLRMLNIPVLGAITG
ncbi:MAG: arginine deiminase-related protein, partial [Dongiaceae bacterium]